MVMVILAMISIAPMLLTKTARITVNDRRMTANEVGLPEFLMICTEEEAEDDREDLKVDEKEHVIRGDRPHQDK
jgi:hypothetical protein